MPLFIRYVSSNPKLILSGAYLFVGRTGTELCPVAAFLDHLCLRGPGDGPLFGSKLASLSHMLAS